MDAEWIRDYCLQKKGVIEGFPFGDNTLVLKAGGKIFLLIALAQNPLQINVKTDPEKSVLLREQYSSIQPGYHMNKKWWNTVTVNGSIPGSLLKELIDESYLLVINSLPKKVRQELL